MSEDIYEIIKEARNLTTKENLTIMKGLVKNWLLGPVTVDPRRNGNKPYYKKLAEAWDITESKARRRKCANCEYFHNNPVFIEALEHIPDNKTDLDGGGRGYCSKFDFICHNLRVCQAWELGSYVRKVDEYFFRNTDPEYPTKKEPKENNEVSEY